MPPLLEKEAAALGPGVARGGDGELPGGASAPDLAGEAMAPVVAAVAGPVLGVVVGGEGGCEELPHRGRQRAGIVAAAAAGGVVLAAWWRGFFYIFRKFFAECRFSTRQSVCRVLNKKHSAKTALPSSFLPSTVCHAMPNVFFPSPCRMFFSLCRVPWAHSKPMNSGSEM